MLYRYLYNLLILASLSQVTFAQNFPPSQVENFNASEFILAGRVTKKITSFREVQSVDEQGNITNKTIEITFIRFQVNDNLEDGNFQPGNAIDIEIPHDKSKDLKTYDQVEQLELDTEIVIGLNPNLTDEHGEAINYSVNTPNPINTYGDLDSLKTWIDKVRRAEPQELNDMIKEEWRDKGLDESYAKLLDEKYENSLNYEFIETSNVDTNLFIEEEESDKPSSISPSETIDTPRQSIETPLKLMPETSIKMVEKQEDIIGTSLLEQPRSSHKTEESKSYFNIKILFIGMFALALAFFMANRALQR